MYGLDGEGSSNQRPSLVNPWWLHPPAGRVVGHERDQESSYLLQGGSESGRDGHEIEPKGDIMDSHEFCLKWNSFSNNLATAFSNLFKTESLTDVTLICEGVQFKAHRVILAACSKHFQVLFEEIQPPPAAVFIMLDKTTSASNMASLLEFMYSGEVHVSQEALSSFLKAAEFLQVKGLSIEHEQLAAVQRHAAENDTPTNVDNGGRNDGNGNGGNGNGGGTADNGSGGGAADNGSAGGSFGSSLGGSVGGSVSSVASGVGTIGTSGIGNRNSSSNGVAVGEVADMSEAAETTMIRNIMKSKTPTPVPSSALAYNAYSTSHYYETITKRFMRSPSDMDTLGRASVLRDGAAFRPASAPQPLLLENHFYQPFIHPPETSAHSHTAPHTPTELEHELERARSEELNNCDLKENVAEDLRIKQEPMKLIRAKHEPMKLIRAKQELTDGERTDMLAERLSSEVYIGRGFDASSYTPNSGHLQHGSQLGPSIVPLPPAHPPTPDLSPAPPTPATWNARINRAGTVSTPDGKKLKCPFCERLYGYETNLRAHIRQRHQGIRVPCPFCSRTFTRNNTVRRHIAREHRNEASQRDFRQANHSVLDSVPQ